LGNSEIVFLNRRLRGVIYALVLWTSNATGQAGPPFRSDDPGTPRNGQWEINIAGVGQRNPSEGRYSLPNLDLNYGLGDRIQLKYEMAYGIEEVRGSTPSVAGGVGNSFAGVKYRFFETPANKTGESNFTMSVYPQLLFSDAVSSSVRRGVAFAVLSSVRMCWPGWAIHVFCRSRPLVRPPTATRNLDASTRTWGRTVEEIGGICGALSYVRRSEWPKSSGSRSYTRFGRSKFTQTRWFITTPCDGRPLALAPGTYRDSATMDRIYRFASSH
jgi:hypothetical protein